MIAQPKSEFSRTCSFTVKILQEAFSSLGAPPNGKRLFTTLGNPRKTHELRGWVNRQIQNGVGGITGTLFQNALVRLLVRGAPRMEDNGGCRSVLWYVVDSLSYCRRLCRCDKGIFLGGSNALCHHGFVLFLVGRRQAMRLCIEHRLIANRIERVVKELLDVESDVPEGALRRASAVRDETLSVDSTYCAVVMNTSIPGMRA